MKRALLLLAGLSLLPFLGGSLLWHLLGFGASLEISGRAVQHTPVEASAWTHYGGDAGGQRFAPIRSITSANVGTLTQAWTYNTGALDKPADAVARANFQATPILVAAALVFCTPFNEVVALDPGTGEERWRFDPKVPTDSFPANGYTCRGVSYWEDADVTERSHCQARIFASTIDARLFALDAYTGERCRDFGRDGEVTVTPSLPLRWPGEYQITSAPAVINDRVVVGSAISDNGRVIAPAGTVHAFDARTGATAWTFDPIPRSDDDPARATWHSDDLPGHANVWSTMAMDADRDLVFLPTSSASPDFYGGLRPGNNEHTSSIVALRASDGTVAWSFQTVHHDIWDYDVPAQPGLYRIRSDSGIQDVVAQATKTGLLFVLDRDTGEPVIPVEERAVPQTAVPGEWVSPTQPFPETPPLVPNRMTATDAFGITAFDRWVCYRRLANARIGGLYTPPSLQGTLVYPFTGGGANWGSTAYDPGRNLLVVNLNNMPHLITLHPTEGVTDDNRPGGHEAEFAYMRGAPYVMTRELLRSP
ncbi:MAG: PQQ-binding-like beta-propeller repeat protein, partial [Pseudomonadota bacterium]